MLLLAAIVGGCGTAARPRPPAAGEVVVDPASTVLRISGSGAALPLVQKLAEAYQQTNPSVRFEFPSGTNSGGAMRGVVEGTLDLAVVNRPLTEKETGAGLVYRPFARDVVAFVAHTGSPIAGVSVAQVQGIFGGQLTDWQSLGIKSAPIIVLDRDEDESMRKLVLIKLMDQQPVLAKAVILTSARDMVTALANTPNSFGYTSLGLLRILNPRGLQVLALDGMVPWAEPIDGQRYPWSLLFGLVHGPDLHPPARRFVEWVRGDGGRQVMGVYGYATVQE